MDDSNFEPIAYIRVVKKDGSLGQEFPIDRSVLFGRFGRIV